MTNSDRVPTGSPTGSRQTQICDWVPGPFPPGPGPSRTGSRTGSENTGTTHHRKEAMADWNPTLGPRIAKAWDAIRRVLLSRTSGMCREDLWEIAFTESDLRLKSCVNVVADAIKHGYLERRGRLITLTEKGRNAA